MLSGIASFSARLAASSAVSAVMGLPLMAASAELARNGAGATAPSVIRASEQIPFLEVDDRRTEAQTLSGREIDLFFNAAGGNPLKIEGRGSMLFKRKRGDEQIQVSGNTFVAMFSSESKNLQSVSVHEQAAMYIEDSEHSMHNELKSEEIRLRFQEVDGRTYFDKLLAEGAARWTSQPNPKSDAVRREPARTGPPTPQPCPGSACRRCGHRTRPRPGPRPRPSRWD